MRFISEAFLSTDYRVFGVWVFCMNLSEIRNRAVSLYPVVPWAQFLHICLVTAEASFAGILLRMVYINFFSGL